MGFALFVGSILNLVKWKETILSLGVRVDILRLIIVKCFAKIVIAKRRTNIDRIRWLLSACIERKHWKRGEEIPWLASKQ